MGVSWSPQSLNVLSVDVKDFLPTKGFKSVLQCAPGSLLVIKCSGQTGNYVLLNVIHPK